MNRYALIRAGVVVNVARAEAAWPGLAEYDESVQLADDQAVAPGYAYAGGVFSAPAPVVPAAVTRRQAMAVLIDQELDDAIEAYFAALPPGKPRKQAENWYRTSQVFERANPFLASLAPLLGLTSEQVDALFIAASTL